MRLHSSQGPQSRDSSHGSTSIILSEPFMSFPLSDKESHQCVSGSGSQADVGNFHPFQKSGGQRVAGISLGGGELLRHERLRSTKTMPTLGRQTEVEAKRLQTLCSGMSIRVFHETLSVLGVHCLIGLPLENSCHNQEDTLPCFFCSSCL